jgi:hypothetical protein
MDEDEKFLWRKIADSLHPQCVNLYCQMSDFIENESCIGFKLESKEGKIKLYCNGVDKDFAESPGIHHILTEKIESMHSDPKTCYNKDLNYVDPPGTFEGISDDCNV